MKSKYLYLIFLAYFSFSNLALYISAYYDPDIKVNNTAFINYLVLNISLSLIIFFLLFYYSYKEKQKRQKQINVLKQEDYLIEEYLNDELAQAFYKRLIHLKNNQLLQNEQQNKWVHDIKLPLATLKLLIDNQRSHINSKSITTLEIIALDFETNINKKIMFDKIELEIDDFKIERFLLEDVITSVIRKFRPSFMMKNLSIDINLNNLEIISDHRSITYCFEQLISNAIKYSYDNSKILLYENDGLVYLVNQGDSISKQDIERVFDKGYTGLNSQAYGMASTGLGLYMVKKSLNHLNHHITIESSNNKTTIILEF